MIGIICAVVEEAEALKKIIDNIREEKVYNTIFYLGNLNGKNVVFAQAGIGKVNAAVTTTLLIERYGVEKVIFSGVAGAVDERVKIGDVVIGTDIVQSDVDATEFGYEKGQIPQMDTLAFGCDSEMINSVKTLSTDIRLFYGRILTGDQFVTGKETKIKLGADFGALCVDMESGAVAQVCYLMKVPFLIVRSISDTLTDESGMEYYEFVKLAAENSKEIIRKIV